MGELAQVMSQVPSSTDITHMHKCTWFPHGSRRIIPTALSSGLASLDSPPLCCPSPGICLPSRQITASPRKPSSHPLPPPHAPLPGHLFFKRPRSTSQPSLIQSKVKSRSHCHHASACPRRRDAEMGILRPSQVSSIFRPLFKVNHPLRWEQRLIVKVSETHLMAVQKQR